MTSNDSFYFSPKWLEFQKTKNPIYYTDYGLASKVFKDLRTAELRFTLVDDNYTDLKILLNDSSYKQRVMSQNCPESVRKQLLQEGFKERKWGTIVVDLTKSEEELWNSIDKKARKVVKKTRKKCKCIVVQNLEQLKRFHTLLVEVRKSMNFSFPTWEGLKHQWQTLGPENYTVFMILDDKDEVLAGMAALHSDRYMKEVSSAQSALAREKKLYANDMLKWELIQWGAKRGLDYYDLAGVHPNPPSGSKLEGIRRFKEKWGGEFVENNFYVRKQNDKLIFKLANLITKDKDDEEE